MVTRLRFYVDILEYRKKSKQREGKKRNKKETRKRKEGKYGRNQLADDHTNFLLSADRNRTARPR